VKNFLQAHAPIAGITIDDSACEVDELAYCGGVQVNVPASDEWDDLVALAVASDWVGIEALSYIDGTVGDAVRTNAAAHGQAVADTVSSVRTWDRSADAQRTFPLADCDFGPNKSRFLETMSDGSERFEVLDVSFLFRQGDLTTPIRNKYLVGVLGIELGGRVSLGVVRDAVRR
jgi:UDP-N-acetylmuramate dehydrogenase